MLQYLMGIFSKIVNKLKVYQKMFDSTKKPTTGPNTLEELLKQFDLPKQEKTSLEVISDYTIKMSMFLFELDYLKNQPAALFRGTQKWVDANGNLYFDWVPVVLRPEVPYCCYYKN